MTTALIATVTLIVILSAATASRAEIVYPWCIQYGGGMGISGTSCGFVSREQCMVTSRGLGAYCVENPAYTGPSRSTKTRRRQ
jgi:hypothetical protein